MLLTQDSYVTQNYIKQVTSQTVQINDIVYRQSLLVMPHKIISPWRPQTFQAVLEEDFQLLLLENRDVILLGVAERGARLSLALYHALLAKKLVIECMSLAAACRTYNILNAEGRQVAAALIFGSN